MRKYLIERDIPGVSGMSPAELAAASAQSNAALAELSPAVQWQHSYVAGNKTFCIYLAQDPEAIQRHATLSGFPAHTVTEIHRQIDPTTAQGV